MRILIAIQSLAPGGTERTLINTLPQLVARGHTVGVVSLWPPYELEPELAAGGVRVHRLVGSHRWNIPQMGRQLAALCAREGYEVLHGKLYFAELSAAAARLFRPQLKVTVSFHNLAHDYEHVPQLKRRARAELEGALVRRLVHTYSAISSPVAEHFTRHLRIEDVQVIHNPIPVDAIVAQAQASSTEQVQAARAEGSYLVVPARLSIEKGHRYLLQALAQLARRGMRPQTYFVGRGPLADDLRREAATLGLADQVRILQDGLPHPECMALMAGASAVVLPSTHEAFGVAAAEGMALKVPVIASAVGGYLDVVEPNISGLLVPARDPARLADALACIMSQPELAEQLAQGGHARVRRAFDVDQIVDRWEDLYERTRNH